MGNVLITRFIEETMVLNLEEHGLDETASEEDILAAAREYDMHAWDGEITDETVEVLDEDDGDDSEDVPLEDLLAETDDASED